MQLRQKTYRVWPLDAESIHSELLGSGAGAQYAANAANQPNQVCDLVYKNQIEYILARPGKQ
jgi:hypothetical protein